MSKSSPKPPLNITPNPGTVPPKPKSGTAELFRENIKAQAKWYRSQERGPILSYDAVAEIVLRNVGDAMDMALKGEKWTPSE